MAANYAKVDAIAASQAPPSTTTPNTTSTTPSPALTWTNHPSAPINHIIIVGAGPSGLLLGILLARRAHIRVTILEAAQTLDANPRAAHYAPSACYDLDRAGVLGKVAERGFFPDSVCWRKQDGELLGGIRNEGVQVDFPMVCLPLDRLDGLLLEEFELVGGQVRFGHRVLGVRQDEGRAEVEVQTEDGKREWVAADYVVGADGANSQIRRSLYGDMNYPGETLEKQIVATNVRYDFGRFGYWDSNFIVHETDWYMAAKITKDGLWRVTYGDEWGLSNEELLSRQPARFEKILPGNPKQGDYELVSASPYKLHQRCAPGMREGRFLLVADAGHLCNPFGGLGLTGGFADVGSLYDALYAIHTGRVPDTRILDEYSRVRIQKWQEVINPMSRKNFGLIWDPAMENDREAFFAFTKKMEGDKELAKQMAHFTHTLREDFEEYIAQGGRGVAPKTGQDLPNQPKGMGAFSVIVEEKVA